MDLPHTITSNSDKNQASLIIYEIELYMETIISLIRSRKIGSYLRTIKETPMSAIKFKEQPNEGTDRIVLCAKLQEQRVETLLEKIERLLLHLDNYVKSLRSIIKKRPNEWRNKSGELVRMIWDMGLFDERGELKKEYRIAILEEQDLERILKDKTIIETLKRLAAEMR